MTVSKKDHMKHFNKQQALSNPINSDQFMTAEVVRHYHPIYPLTFPDPGEQQLQKVQQTWLFGICKLRNSWCEMIII